ncbi:hypothetical protein [Winogradskyella psychrotolerans]|uniref:hypothetical protein n=1 Tax=Winogradskyella psychrotolerans TaxID=1344585 RepID=UPI001C06FD9B|nr:hypothetical protein [Winogradskyella psychrotolerans]MBU2927481.1 hypothetical protein [Winogradskyella psychrotolerans]
MKSLYLGLICLLLFSSCKSDKSESRLKEIHKEPTIARKIANSHGFENWKNVSEVKFTFQVDRDTIQGKGRTWTWNPKTKIVNMETDTETVSYIQNPQDSMSMAADRAFINDKFWLLVPFQLVWDSTATVSEPKKAIAPISKNQLNLITLTYPNEGGYTPGDAYDIFYGDDFMIKEWIFRKGNSQEPTLATTFENYKDYNGIKIATDHKMEGGHWNLNFTDVSITLDATK